MRRRDFGLGALVALIAAKAKAQLFSPQLIINQVSPPPTGATGIWYADQYDSAKAAIPNSLGSTLSTNLWRAPRRRFADSNYWKPTGVTVTDNAVTAPDGSTQASTAVCTGAWTFYNGKPDAIGSATFPAGTYTLGINVKRNTGSDQQFAFTNTNTGVVSAAQTATASWQRFTYTFVKASPFSANAGIGLCSIDGATGANLQICDMELYAGSSDLGPSVLSGDLYLGITKYDTNPGIGTGYVDFTPANATGIMQAAAPLGSLSAFTIIGLVKKTTASQTYPNFFSSGIGHTGAAAEFGAMLKDGPTDVKYLGFDAGGAGLFDLVAAGNFHVVTHRWDGTTSEIWIDDVLLNSATDAATITLNDLFQGSWPYFSGAVQVSAIGLWLRKLTDQEVRSVAGIFSARFGSSYFNRILIATGDSITGSASFDYPFQAVYSPAVFGSNRGQGGFNLASLVTQAPLIDAAIPASINPGRKFILSVLIGANESIITDTATYSASLAAYLDARRAARFKVVICTILPRTGGVGGFLAARNTVNTEIRLWTTGGSVVPGIHADAICDFAADPTMGPDAAASNTTYYSDGLHPTAAGQLILAGIYATTVNAL